MKTLSDFYRLFPSHPAMIGRNAQAIAPQPVAAPVAVAPANDDTRTESAPRYRARDYGTGYGRSSGYAGTARSYGPAWRPSVFRLR